MRVQCSQCRASYSLAAEEIAGRYVKFKCRRCSELVRVDGRPSMQPADKEPDTLRNGLRAAREGRRVAPPRRKQRPRPMAAAPLPGTRRSVRPGASLRTLMNHVDSDHRVGVEELLDITGPEDFSSHDAQALIDPLAPPPVPEDLTVSFSEPPPATEPLLPRSEGSTSDVTGITSHVSVPPEPPRRVRPLFLWLGATVSMAAGGILALIVAQSQHHEVAIDQPPQVTTVQIAERSADLPPKAPDDAPPAVEAPPATEQETPRGTARTARGAMKSQLPVVRRSPSDPEAESPAPKARNVPRAPVSSATAPFDRAAASAALSNAAGGLSSCMVPGGPVGVGKVQVTFQPSGRVTATEVIGGNFRGTSTGGCVARTFRRAQVPPFVGSPVTVAKSFVVH
jgi:predicted Zn finger-like uncharacterized protein